MNRKKVVTLIVLSLITSLVAGLQFVDVAKANPSWGTTATL